MSNLKRHVITKKEPTKLIANKLPGKISFTPITTGLTKFSSKKVDKSISKMMKIDEIVSRETNGCYTVSGSKKAPKYKAKQLCEYAQAHGKNTSDLSDQELAMFIID